MNSSERPPADDRGSLPHPNLSLNKSLRTLETTAESIDAADDTASDFFKMVLSSIAPSTPLDVVVIYRDIDLSDMPHCSWCNLEIVRRRYSREKPIDRVARLRHQFKVLGEMHSARDFHLVLCVDAFDCMVEGSIEMLERVAKAEGAVGGFGRLQKPLIISERRTLRSCYIDRNAGWSREGVFASAL